MLTTGGAKPLLTGGGAIVPPPGGQQGGGAGGGQQGGALATLLHPLWQAQPVASSAAESKSPAPNKRVDMGVSSLAPAAGRPPGGPKIRWVGGAGRDLSPR